MYKLNSGFARSHFTVTVVGCGGTGGFVAESLCRLLPPRADLVLVDHDRVEEANLRRQNFLREEMGQFKAEALAHRLSRSYGLPVGYSTFPIALTQIRYPGLIIGCVDNGLARRDIAARVEEESSLTWVGGYSMAAPPELQTGPHRETALWWVDAGNGENYGQVLIGNHEAQYLQEAFDKDICVTLPLPTIQMPQLLAQLPPQRDCAEAVATGEQAPMINQAMAALVVEVVRRLIEGTCPWMQLYLDLEAGMLSPVLATPEAVAKITGIRKALLIERR